MPSRPRSGRSDDLERALRAPPRSCEEARDEAEVARGQVAGLRDDDHGARERLARTRACSTRCAQADEEREERERAGRRGDARAGREPGARAGRHPPEAPERLARSLEETGAPAASSRPPANGRRARGRARQGSRGRCGPAPLAESELRETCAQVEGLEAALAEAREQAGTQEGRRCDSRRWRASGGARDELGGDLDELRGAGGRGCRQRSDDA